MHKIKFDQAVDGPDKNAEEGDRKNRRRHVSLDASQPLRVREGWTVRRLSDNVILLHQGRTGSVRLPGKPPR